MKTITIPAKEVTLYEFNELSQEVKDKLIEQHKERLSINGYTWDCELWNSLQAAAAVFGIEIEENSYGHFFVSSVPYNMEPENMNFKRTIAYINNHFDFKTLSYSIRQKIKYMNSRQSGNVVYPATAKYYDDTMLTGYCADYCIQEAYKDFVNQQKKRYEYNAAMKNDKYYQKRKESFNLTLDDFFTILCEHFEKERDNDREYEESEEHFEEMMNDTDTWFLEDGTIFSGEVA